MRNPKPQTSHSPTLTQIPSRHISNSREEMFVVLRVYMRLSSYLLPKFTYVLTYFLTPWSRVLLQKLTGSQLVKKFPTFYGTRRFITAFTSARHLSQLYPVHTSSHFLKIYLNVILPSTPGSPKWSLFLMFPHQNPVYASRFPHTHYMPRPSHSSRFYQPNSTE